jgi:hypothetical protein
MGSDSRSLNAWVNLACACARVPQLIILAGGLVIVDQSCDASHPAHAIRCVFAYSDEPAIDYGHKPARCNDSNQPAAMVQISH